MSNDLSGRSSLAYQGTNSPNPPRLTFKKRDPISTDYQNFSLGDIWINSANQSAWILMSLAGFTATWFRFSGQGGGVTTTLEGNSGGVVNPDGSGNINVVGDGTTIDIAGNPGTNTLTVSFIGSGVGASSFPTDAGTATAAGGVLEIVTQQSSNDCGMTVFFDGSSNVVSLNVSDIDSNTCVGQFSGNVSATAPAFNSSFGYASLQSIDNAIGNTAVGYQSLASIDDATYNIAIGYQSGLNYTAEGSNIVIGNMGSISDTNTIRIGTQGVGDSEQDTCFIAGIRGTVVASPQFVTIDPNGQLGSLPSSPSGGGITWSVIATSQTAVINNGYFTNGGAPVVVTLPAASAVGDQVAVSAMNANGWQIAQGVGQSIRMTNLSTTVGAGGSLASTSIGDTVYLVCNVANTSWIAISSMGNITIV